jgi:hypothetical protein
METDQDLYRKMFRMSVDSFKDLVDMLDAALTRNVTKSIASIQVRSIQFIPMLLLT